MTFEPHRDIMNAKLKRANNLLAISRHYLPKDLLMQIYYGQSTHTNYGCQLWGVNENDIAKTITLQKRAVRILSFAHFEADVEPLFKQ